MLKKAMFVGLVVAGVFGIALVVGAQGPGPRGREGFGPGGPGGWGPPCTSGCPVYQFTFTRTVTQPVFSKGSTTPTTTTNTTTGTIASYSDGSSYRDVTVSAVGPWQSQSGSQEIIFVRDMVAKMEYIEHMNKSGTSTYEQFPIQPPPSGNRGSNWQGAGPGKGPGKGPSNNQSTTKDVTLPDGTHCTAEETTITHGDSVVHRIFCPSLRLLVEEDRNDRFGQSSYTLGPSPNTAPTSFPFKPTGTLVQHPQFGRGHGPRGDGPRP